MLANDSYLTSSPITVTPGNPSNGLTALAESSPEQITYTPDNNFTGTDTFTTQLQRKSIWEAVVTIEVKAILILPINLMEKQLMDI